MTTASSKSTVRKIDERNGEFWVSFITHDGYFTAEGEDLRQKLRAARDKGVEISFTYDKTLNILAIE